MIGFVLVILLIVVVLCIAFIKIGNKLVRYKNEVDSKFSDIDVILERRADLIPNLVSTVKGYAKHEAETLENVIKARNQAITGASNLDEKIEASNQQAQDVLSRLMVIQEAYPDLKANRNFESLQEELSNTENKVANARLIYNNTVKAYNNQVEMFPSSAVANMKGYKVREFLTIPSEKREAVKVEF